MRLLKFFTILALVSILLPPSIFAAGAQPGHLNILTSFPPEFYQPFIKGFQLLHPDIQVQILNKKTTAALEELRKGNFRKFDVFWSSSLDAFLVLKDAGMLQQTDIGPRPHEQALEDIPLHDPEGCYHIFALSSVGFMWSKKFLRENNLPEPADWEALSTPVYYGHLAMSTPSRSGTTHLVVESILQSMGWQQGWNYLLQTSGNLATVTARSFSVPEGILSGRFGIGFVIDFLAEGQKSANKDIGFRYGQPTLLMPAAAGLPRNGENRSEAKAFIEYLLSPAGQKILLEPTISRLPVSTAIYTPGGPPPPELYQRIRQDKTSPYDTGLSQSRYQLINDLFDQLITYRLSERRKIWKKLIELDGREQLDPVSVQAVKDAVRHLIYVIPVSERESIDPAFTSRFAGIGPAAFTPEQKRQQFQAWDDLIDGKLHQAEALLDEALHKPADERP